MNDKINIMSCKAGFVKVNDVGVQRVEKQNDGSYKMLDGRKVRLTQSNEWVLA